MAHNLKTTLAWAAACAVAWSAAAAQIQYVDFHANGGQFSNGKEIFLAQDIGNLAEFHLDSDDTYDFWYDGDFQIPTRKGHAFNGWFKAKSGGRRVDENTAVSGGTSLTLYAQWLKTDALAIGTAVDDDSLAFTTGGNGGGGGWFGQTSDSHDGADAARSGQIGDRQSTWMETTVKGPATLSFWWKTSCEDARHSWSWDFSEEFLTYVDSLSFTIDGTTMAQLAGRGDWEQRSFELEAGEHTLRWQFDKDSSHGEGMDCAWVDQIEWRYPHKVKFDANEGTCAVSTKTVLHGTAIGELPTATRNEHTFLGWHTAKTGGKKIGEDTTITKSRTLYAQWAKTAYQVAFQANGGTGTMAKQGMTYGKSAKLHTNAFQRTGYTFAGWAKSKTGKVAYKDGASVKNLRTDGKTTTLYAQWTPNVYQVAFKANGGKGTMAKQGMTYGKSAKLRANAFTRKGYMFAGWAKSKTGAVAYTNGATVKNLRTDSGTTTFYARWAKPTYQVAFKANGGTGTMAKQTMTYGKSAKLRVNAFKRTGYTFAGWAKTKSGAVVYKNGASVKNLRMDGKTATLYAQWAPKSYQVAFQANGGSGTMAKQTMTYGKSAKLRANAFTRKGYIFAGWAKTKTGAVAYKDGASVKNLRSDGKTTTLYAAWKPTSYQVAFLANGGEGTMDAQTISYGVTETLRANAFTWEGHTFAGWAKTATGEVAYADQAEVKNLRNDGGTVTLHAVWEQEAEPEVLPEAGNDVEVAKALGGAADARLAEHIRTVADYAAFRTWARGVKGRGRAVSGVDAVMASEHAWSSYRVGAETLSENELDIRLTGFAVGGAQSEGASRKAGGTVMTIRVQVRDGDEIASVDVDKIAAQFKATSDLSDWAGEARIEPIVTPAGVDDDGTLVFHVEIGDKSVSRAFFAVYE